MTTDGARVQEDDSQFGPYRLLEKIGQGGMAEVFKAEKRGAMDFTREVCIKRIRRGVSADSDFVDMFIDEARLCAKLRHNNIVTIEDFGEHDGQLFLCMELVNGVDAMKIVRMFQAERAMVPVDMALHVVREVLRALEYAHGKTDRGAPLGIVHRDVTPHNILVSFAGDVKLSDFGIAKASARMHQTSGDIVKGKLAYMAPEQATGVRDLDGRVDLFALGIVAFELLTGQRPFPGVNEHAVMSMLEGRRVEALSLRPDLSPAVVRFVDTMLQRDRAQRYAHAAEALDAMNTLPFQTGERTLKNVLAERFEGKASVAVPAFRDPSRLVPPPVADVTQRDAGRPRVPTEPLAPEPATSASAQGRARQPTHTLQHTSSGAPFAAADPSIPKTEPAAVSFPQAPAVAVAPRPSRAAPIAVALLAFVGVLAAGGWFVTRTTSPANVDPPPRAPAPSRAAPSEVPVVQVLAPQIDPPVRPIDPPAAPSVTPSAAPSVTPSVAPSVAAGDEGESTPVRFVVLPFGTLYVDNREVAHDRDAWAGTLPAGRHAFRAECGAARIPCNETRTLRGRHRVTVTCSCER